MHFRIQEGFIVERDLLELQKYCQSPDFWTLQSELQTWQGKTGSWHIKKNIGHINLKKLFYFLKYSS